MPGDNVVGVRQNAINFDAFREAMNASVNDPQKSGGKSVIRLAGADGVSTQKWVRLGTRSDAFKSANLAARQALLNALLHETGAARVDDFPEGLKAALKLEDFRLDENGRVMSEKPLTARRIRCIATEVDKIRVSRGTTLDSVRGSLDGDALKAVVTNKAASGYLVLDGQGKPGFVATPEAYRKNYGGDDVLRRETNRNLANGVQKCLGLSEGPASRKARRLLRLDESPVPVVRSPIVRELNILAEKQKLCLENWGTAIRYVLVDSEKATGLKFGQSDFDRYRELSAERGDSMDAFFAFLMEKGLREADFVPRFKHVGEAKRPGNAEEERELMQANPIEALPENEDDIAPLNIDAEEHRRPERSSDLNRAWEYLSVVNSLLLLLSE